MDPAAAVTPDWERNHKEPKQPARYFANGKT